MKCSVSNYLLIAGLVLPANLSVHAMDLYHLDIANNRIREIPGFKLRKNSYPKNTYHISESFLKKRYPKDLDAPPDLSLPDKTSEINIIKKLKIEIDDIENIVEANNPELRIYNARIKSAKSTLLSTIASWYPTLDLTANGLPQYLDGSQFNNPEADTSSKQWSANFSIQAKWNLIDPGRKPQISAAKDRYEKARNLYSMKLKEIKKEALEKYFSVQAADEGVRIGKSSLQSSMENLKNSQVRFEAGLGTKLEILEAKAQLARDQKLLTSKLGSQKISQRKLAEILNLPENITPIPNTSPRVLGIWTATLEESIIAAYSTRKELSNILLDISINNSDANQALASSQPIISLVNTYGATYTRGQVLKVNPDINDSGSSFSNTVGLNVTWSIFDGGKSKSLYDSKKYQSKEAESNFAFKRGQIRSEVEESYYNLMTAKDIISSSYDQVVASKESLRLESLKFKAGISSQKEVIDSQRDLTDSEVQYVESITSYNKNLINLRSKAGINNIRFCKEFVSYKRQESMEMNIDFCKTHLRRNQ